MSEKLGYHLDKSVKAFLRGINTIHMVKR